MSAPHGRGAGFNPANRFEKLHVEPLREEQDEGAAKIPTTFYRDASRSILAGNDSPDIPFDYSINPYRGCEHGCVYCYARPTHEYLGFSAGTDFESRIMVKMDAPALLEEALGKQSWEPQVVALSGNTDCYQPVERELELTRRCLEVFLRFRNPVSVITKSSLVTRDLDVLGEMASLRLVHVSLSITTLDPDLARRMEPRASTPARRLEAMEALAAAGVPTGIVVAPLIPGLTDEEVGSILRAASARGARSAGYVLLRLPHAVESLFSEWLHRELPLRADRVLGRLRQVRGGDLSDSRFGTRQRGEGVMAGSLESLFDLCCRRYGLNREEDPLATEHFRVPGARQMELF